MNQTEIRGSRRTPLHIEQLFLLLCDTVDYSKHIAAEFGHYSTVKVLLQHQANKALQTTTGLTAEQIAKQKGLNE